MIEPTDRIAVAFSGEGGGVEELTWGQRTIWIAMVEQETSLPVGGRLPLPEGTTVQDMVTELSFLMSRHQSMRMRLVFGDDGRPRQAVAGSGEVVLEVYDAGADDDAEVLAEKVMRQYMAVPFRYESEWPVRMAVIRRAGVPVQVVNILCHLVTDAEGGIAMMADLSNLDRAAGVATAPVTSQQPLELARWQRSPAGVQRSARSLRYWEEQLRAVPAYRYREPTTGPQPRHWEGKLTSPAVHLAAHALAARFKASTSQVLLAAYVTVLARIRRVDPVVVRPIVSNRFQPGLADIVSPINQAGLCVIPVGEEQFGEVVGRTRRAVMRAFKAAYYDPEPHAELLAAIAKDRGEELVLDCLFNDRRSVQASAPQRLTHSRTRGVFEWTAKQDKSFGGLFLHLDDAAEGVTLTIRADTHQVAPEDVKACVLEIESLLVREAETGS